MSQLAEQLTVPSWLQFREHRVRTQQSNLSGLNRPCIDPTRRVRDVLEGTGDTKFSTGLGGSKAFNELEPARPRASAPVAPGSALSASPSEARKPAAMISTDSARFAKQHGMWGSLVIVQSLILRHADVVSALEIELVRDTEIDALSVICFVVRTRAALERVLEMDSELQSDIIDSTPPSHQEHIAVRFQFA